ncbi:MAG: hypothetical protein IJM30_09215 [Thermoguttaceae bacterium]|nr:hypothetical protein [Thermoguttaceae bacterium]
MRIDRLEGYLVRLPLKRPERVADATVDHCDVVVVRLESQGVSGWGEVAPGNSPLTTSEWSGGTFLTLRDQIAPRVLEKGGIASVEILEESVAKLRGNKQAKGALELAWQDLNARLLGKPLWKVLGGEKKPLKIGLTFDRSIQREEFFSGLQRAVDENFGRVTLKIRPGWDLQVVSFARVDYPSWLRLQVDVEGELDFDKHADTLYRMDDFSLTCVEQPLAPRDFVAHAMLKDAIRTPLCLDESIESLSDAEIALDVECCGFFCLKPGRVGGLAESRRIAELAETKNVGCYAGFDLQTSLGFRALAALSSTSNFALPMDYVRFDEIFEYDPVPALPTILVEEPGDEKKGRPARNFRYVELWDEPGLGAEPDLEELKKFAVDQFQFVRSL